MIFQTGYWLTISQKHKWVSFWFSFSLIYLVQREVKPKGPYLESNSHIQFGNQDSSLHIVRTYFIIGVIITKLWILLPKFLLAVEFTSLIQHIAELLISQAAFEAFSISQKTDVKKLFEHPSFSTQEHIILYLVLKPGIRQLLFW